MWLQLTLSHLATQSGNSQRQFLAVAEGCEELPNGRGTAGARLGHGWGTAGAWLGHLELRSTLGRWAARRSLFNILRSSRCHFAAAWHK